MPKIRETFFFLKFEPQSISFDDNNCYAKQGIQNRKWWIPKDGYMQPIVVVTSYFLVILSIVLICKCVWIHYLLCRLMINDLIAEKKYYIYGKLRQIREKQINTKRWKRERERERERARGGGVRGSERVIW